MTLEVGGRRHVAATRLVGRHWALAVALALATAVALGAEVEGALDAIGALEPSAERLELVDAPGGARLLLDTTKATEATMAPAFAALAALPARRRVAVIGSLWDFVGATEVEVVDRVARDALAVADEVILYGPAAQSAPAGLVDGRRVRAALSIHALSDDLHARFGHGDLVLLKGTFPYDHLVRIALVGTHDVRCWRDDCARRTRCGECRLLGPALK